jgi:hypothetical protein
VPFWGRARLGEHRHGFGIEDQGHRASNLSTTSEDVGPNCSSSSSR